jgi:hypothetical protein
VAAEAALVADLRADPLLTALRVTGYRELHERPDDDRMLLEL